MKANELNTRKQAKQRALELYPKSGNPWENYKHKILREIYLQCWEDMNEQQEDSVCQCEIPNCDMQGMCFKCNLKVGVRHPNQLREAAEMLLETYKNCTGTVNGGWTEWSKRMERAHKNLEKALNQ